jgi:transposase-like protein
MTAFSRPASAGMDDLSAFCRVNPDCPDHGQRDRGNLRIGFRYGPRRRRLLVCRTCQHRFSERNGTPLFGSRLPEEKVVSVLQHVAEGCGTRATSRLTGVNKDTVTRYTRLAGSRAEAAHDELVAFSPLDPRDPVRREVGLRPGEGEAPRPRRPRR